MKHFLLSCLTFLIFISLCEAHKFAPPTLETLAKSGLIWIVRVASNKTVVPGSSPEKITFSITDVLREPDNSEPPPFEALIPYPGSDFKEGSEWILVNNPSGFKGCVGWATKGDCEWLPIRVTGEGDKAIAQWLGPLDKIKEYLNQHPYKP